MKQIQKPDSHYANEIISKAEKLRKDTKNIISDYENNCRDVLNSYQSAKKEIVQSALQNIPIERLNDAGKGFRLATFRNVGIVNISQLLEVSDQLLNSIKGVGELTARQAKAAASSIEHSVQENTGFRIDPAQKAPAENNDQAWVDFITHSADYYSLLETITKTKVDTRKSQGDLPQELVERVESQELNRSLLKSSLRGYQEFGAKYAIVQQRTLLGDEMGLGKTVEAIAAISHLQAEGATYFVVVCPASVLINWYNEITKHSRPIPYKIHGVDREKELEEWVRSSGVVVTTYETLKRIEFPAKLKIDFLVADEAHYAKNPSAQRTQALYKLTERSERVLFMTGTPIENRVDEDAQPNKLSSARYCSET